MSRKKQATLLLAGLAARLEPVTGIACLAPRLDIDQFYSDPIWLNHMIWKVLMSMSVGRKSIAWILLLGVLTSIVMLPDGAFASDPVPKDIFWQIEDKAERDFPDDKKKRRWEISNQMAAYKRIRDYRNPEIPPNVLKHIKMQASLYSAKDYLNQLFLINKHVNSYIKLGILSSRLSIAETVDCKFLRWNLTMTGSPAIYRGTIKAGSADVIHVEVRNKSRIIAQDFGFPNPRGAWEIILWGDYQIAEKHTETFICEKYRVAGQ